MFSGLSYVLFLIFVMIITGLLNDSPLFSNLFYKLYNTVKNTRIALFLFSMIAGVLPVPGRVTITAGILDNIVSKDNEPKIRKKLGVIDFLSSHHYYLWSPLEKTIIIPMAVLGLTYSHVVTLLMPLIILTFLYIFVVIYYMIPKDIILKLNLDTEMLKNSKFTLYDKLVGITAVLSIVGIFLFNASIIFGLFLIIVILLKKYFFGYVLDYKSIISYINVNLVLLVFFAIILGNIMKISGLLAWFIAYSASAPFIIVLLLSFCIAFLLGSSSKFSGLVSYLTLVFGVHYFVLFFSIEYAAYLLSPFHKCTLIGRMYFQTPAKLYYSVMLIWGILMIALSLILLL